MSTDFGYDNKTINSTGPIKPSGINQPLDPRTEVKLYADIETIPNPYVGMVITVLQDETNSNKMTDYKVLSLKANNLGVANSVIDQVQRYVDYLGASSGGGVSQEDINTAVNNYLTEHPVQSGATAEQAAQIQANTTAIGDENSGLTKEVNDIKNTELQNLNAAIQRVNETVGNKTGLPSGDANVIASINRIDSSFAKTTDLNNKVDKIIGKQLTTNDYTNEEKQTLASLKTTVGDTSSGLVKDVKDLKNNGVSQDNVNSAIEKYMQDHPVQSGATAEQVAQIEANRTAIGDANGGLTKEINDIKNTELQNLNTAINTLETLVGDKTGLPSGDTNIIASINRIDGKTSSGSGLTDEQLNKLNSIDNKVDKIIGKQLSTEDYTSQEKADLASLKTTVGNTSSGLVKDVEDLKTNGVSQDNINSAIEKYMQDNPMRTEDYDPNSVFFIGNMDTNIVTDGLVLWLSKDIRKDKTLYDLSGNDYNVTFAGNGVSFDENGDMITNSNNGIVHSIIEIPQTEIITMEFTTSHSSMDIGDQCTPITTFSDDDNAGMKFGVKSNQYITWGVKYKTGDATGDAKVINASTGATELSALIPQFTVNKINHVAYRYNSLLKRIEIFINGTPFTHYIDFTDANEPNLLVSAIGFFRRDANTNPTYTPSNDYKNGKAYDIKAYSKMLSNEEILQNYNNLVKNGVISNG